MRLLRLIFLLTLLLGLAGCAVLQEQLKNPEVAVQKVDITRLSLTDMDLGVQLGIDNPNPFGIALAGLDYRVEIEGQPLIRGQSDQRVKVASGGKSQLTLPLSLHYQDMADGLGALLRQDRVAYTLSGKLDFGLISVPYSHRGELDLPSLPRLSVEALEVEQLTLQGVSLLLSLGLENPNDFPINLNGMRYDLSLAGRQVSRGESIAPMAVEAGAKGRSGLRLQLDYAAIGNLITTLSSGSTIPVAFDASMSLPGLAGEQQLPLQWQGDVAIRR